MKWRSWFTEVLALEPLDRASFLRWLGIYVFFQTGILISTLWVYSYGSKLGNANWIAVGVLSFFGLQLGLCVFCFRKRILQRRLLALYPSFQAPRFVTFEAWLLLPVLGIPFLIFLILKKPELSMARMPILLRRSGWGTIVILVFVVVFEPGFGSYLAVTGSPWANPGSTKPTRLGIYGYLFMEPFSSYILTLRDEVSAISELSPLKDPFSLYPEKRTDSEVNADETHRRIQAYNQSHVLSTVGVIFELSLVVMVDIEKKRIQDRKVSSVSPNETALGLVQDLVTVLQAGEGKRLAPFGFNPVSLFNPFGALEIAWITSVEVATDLVSADAFGGQVDRILGEIEKRLPKEKSPFKEALSQRISALRERFRASPTYRMHQSIEATSCGRLLKLWSGRWRPPMTQADSGRI